MSQQSFYLSAVRQGLARLAGQPPSLEMARASRASGCVRRLALVAASYPGDRIPGARALYLLLPFICRWMCCSRGSGLEGGEGGRQIRRDDEMVFVKSPGIGEPLILRPCLVTGRRTSDCTKRGHDARAEGGSRKTVNCYSAHFVACSGVHTLHTFVWLSTCQQREAETQTSQTTKSLQPGAHRRRTDDQNAMTEARRKRDEGSGLVGWMPIPLRPEIGEP